MIVNELHPLQEKILDILKGNIGYGFSSREISDLLIIAHSTARKYLKKLYDDGILKRGKQKDFNKTFFYYVEY